MTKDKFFWLSLICGGLILLPTLWFNFSMDQSIYSYGAWVWKYYHLPPYVGVWDQNFPGIFFIHRLALEIFGESVLGFRLFDFLAQLIGVGAIFYLVRRLSGASIAGFLGSIFYSIFYYSLDSMHTGQREGFIFLLLLLSMALGAKESLGLWFKIAGVGLLSGFAFLIKPFFGLAGIVFGFFFLIKLLRKPVWLVFFGVLFFSICYFLSCLLLLWFYWRGNYLRELYQATLWYNFMVYSSWPPLPFGTIYLIKTVLKSMFSQKLFFLLIGVLGIYPSFILARRNKEGALFWLILSLMLVGLSAYLLSGKFIDYQLIPFWGFLSMFACTGAYFFRSKIQVRLSGIKGKIIIGLFYLVLIFLLVITTVNRYLIRFPFQYAFRNLELAYVNARGNFDAKASADFYLTARYLSRNLKPGDEIEFFGPYPLNPFLVKRKLPSRFCAVQHLLFLPREGEMLPLQKQWLQEYQSAVIKANPKFFLICDVFPDNMFFHLATRSLKQALPLYFPKLNHYFKSRFQFVQQIGLVEIYVQVSEE